MIWIKALLPVFAALCEEHVHIFMFLGLRVNLCYQPGTQAAAAWLLEEGDYWSSGLKVHRVLIALNPDWFLGDKYLLILREIKGRWESGIQRSLVWCDLFLHSLLLSAAAWWPLGLPTLYHQSYTLCSFGKKMSCLVFKNTLFWTLLWHWGQ